MFASIKLQVKISMDIIVEEKILERSKINYFVLNIVIL